MPRGRCAQPSPTAPAAVLIVRIPGLASLTRHILLLRTSFCKRGAHLQRLDALRLFDGTCYGLRLKPFVEASIPPVSLSIRFVRSCHEHSLSCLFFLSFAFLLLSTSLPARAQQDSTAPPEAPGPNDTRLFADKTEESRGNWKYLRGGCRIVTHEEEVNADEIDFNSVTQEAYLRGHVHYRNFTKGDTVEADRGVYNLKTQEGKFYRVKGTSPAHGIYEPWLLRTSNPFYFEGEWAERHGNRYVIHHGFITDCGMPKPWWVLRAPIFDVIPDDRAIAHKAVFRLKNVPVLYLPAFYRPLGRKDRQSGFLTPNIGHSSYLGYMYGIGYYWAINRSYDAMYRTQYFSQRGFAHTLDFRGKPTQQSDFDFQLYGVKDRGLNVGPAAAQSYKQQGLPTKGDDRLDQSGLQFRLVAKTSLGDDWVAALDLRYLSSYLFRQSFTQSFNDSILSEVDSVGYVQKQAQDYTVNIAYERQQLFESNLPRDFISVQKLPSVDFIVKDRQLLYGRFPLWASLDTNVSVMRRQEPTYQTSNMVNREDIEPRVMTAFNFKGFALTPSVTFHGTHWGDSLSAPSQLSTVALFRKAADAQIDVVIPPVERVFNVPKSWGQKLKHVIEPRASYRYVTGVTNFNKTIRFDGTELLSNTNQLKLSILNRVYLKNKQGKVVEIFNWEVAQQRYFDPTFGGALIPGQSNIFSVTEDLTPFTFITRPRNYSPIDSVVRLNPSGQFGMDWRVDYDPLYKRFTNDTLNATYRLKKNYFVTAGYRELYPDPAIQSYASQVSTSVGYGSSLRKGWNVAVSSYYDVRKDLLEYFLAQATYNTDCCGFTFEVKRFSFGFRNENQILFSFVLANIGSFGSLRRQDRVF
jgi:LPS-assembly protein